MQTYTSHEFNQHASEAQKAAHAAPVLITSQGKPDLVLIYGKKENALILVRLGSHAEVFG